MTTVGERQRRRKAPFKNDLEETWLFAVEKARRRGGERMGTLWARIDKRIVYRNEAAPHGVPRRYFDLYYHGCFTEAVLDGDPGFFATMERARNLLLFCFASRDFISPRRDRKPVPELSEKYVNKNIHRGKEFIY